MDANNINTLKCRMKNEKNLRINPFIFWKRYINKKGLNNVELAVNLTVNNQRETFFLLTPNLIFTPD